MLVRQIHQSLKICMRVKIRQRPRPFLESVEQKIRQATSNGVLEDLPRVRGASQKMIGIRDGHKTGRTDAAPGTQVHGLPPLIKLHLPATIPPTARESKLVERDALKRRKIARVRSGGQLPERGRYNHRRCAPDGLESCDNLGLCRQGGAAERASQGLLDIYIGSPAFPRHGGFSSAPHTDEKPRSLRSGRVLRPRGMQKS